MAPVTRLERGTPALREASITHLEELGVVLTRQGLSAQPVVPPGRVPRLQVTHANGRTEDVYTGRCEDGIWWFWWPWAQRIATVSEVGEAATAIERQLRAPAAD